MENNKLLKELTFYPCFSDERYNIISHMGYKKNDYLELTSDLLTRIQNIEGFKIHALQFELASMESEDIANDISVFLVKEKDSVWSQIINDLKYKKGASCKINKFENFTKEDFMNFLNWENKNNINDLYGIEGSWGDFDGRKILASYKGIPFILEFNLHGCILRSNGGFHPYIDVRLYYFDTLSIGYDLEKRIMSLFNIKDKEWNSDLAVKNTKEYYEIK